MDGLTTLKGGLTIGGIDTNIDSNMTVKKKSIFKENVNIEGNLNVKESVVFLSSQKILANLDVISNMNISDKLIVYNNTILKEYMNLNVYGDVLINKNMNVYGNLDVSKDLIVYNNTKLNENVNIVGNLNVNKDINVYGNITANIDVNVVGNVNIEKELMVKKDVDMRANVNIKGITSIDDGLILPRENKYNESGSVYYNKDLNKFYGHYGVKGWKNLGGIDDTEDTVIHNNLTVNENVNVLGNMNIKNALILPLEESNQDRGLYIKYNNVSNENELKLRLNNIENSIILNKANVSHLSRTTDLFQFYNVVKDVVSYGNRVTGLSDPQFTSFTKFYVLQEYIFNEEETVINNVEFYMSKTRVESETINNLSLSVIKMNGLNETVVQTSNIASGGVLKGRTYLRSIK